MELSSLAAKQKRIKDLSALLLEVQKPTVRAHFEQVLSEFKSVLAECWRAGEITAVDEHRILDLERQLEALGEEARLRA